MSSQRDSKHVFQQKLWLGISNLLKEPSSQDPYQPTNFYYSENINVRTDPYAPTLNVATVKESGGTVTDFVKWADITPASLVTYLYGDSGSIYSRTTGGSWSNLHQAASSHGNGLQYFYGDDYVYYAQDSTIGRYGPLASTPLFTDDFLTAQGGVPQNTYSLSVVSGSSQYASAADSATLEVTGNLTLEAYVYLNSLPTVGNSMVVVGKWDESGVLRSYIMDIYGVSGYFGDGSDGALTISVNTTEAPIDSSCNGISGNYTLTATNVSFALNQQILIHQTQGTNAGQYERNIISGYSAGTITLQTPLLGTYTSGAQVRVLKQHTNVTVNAGITYKPKAWNGTTGGILSFLANGTVTIGALGAIVADGTGFRGAPQPSGTIGAAYIGFQGEGTMGVGGTVSSSANGNGGGGGQLSSGAGAGGGNATQGNYYAPYDGVGGSISGSSDLTTMTFGGGGGGGAYVDNNWGGMGGNGGGIIFITAVGLAVSGSITSIGLTGLTASSNSGGGGGGGGGGAGGSILLKVQTATLGTNQVEATGGAGGVGVNGGITARSGANGRLVLDYLTSFTGTTNLPSITTIQDNTLVTSTTYQLRLGISNDGTANEYLTKNLPSLAVSQWNRFSISWTAASSIGTFYLNGSSLGTTTGTKTSISSNASLLYIGAKKGASVVGSFLDGYIDDVRVWGNVQSSSNIAIYVNKQLTGNEGGLKAYYKLNNATTDSSGNTNTLTLHSATYTAMIPFVDPTTRLDIDQSYTSTGSTYAVPVAVSEVAADQLPFTPANDPQKSMDINISAKGTGNWTLTIHDQANTVIATKTITNANMASAGYQEFVWTTPWRIVIGKSYHAHITSTVADGTVVTSSLNVLQSAGSSVADFHTYFQFLVTDSLFHPIIRWLNFLVIGNERYLAKWDGAFYSPNLIAFPQGTHVRCFGTWGIYLAIGVWQEAGTGTPNVYDFPTGKIYFWDGISLTFNFSIDVPEGQVNAIFGMDSDLYYFAGWKGDLLYYQGSWANQSGSFNGTKVKRIPYLEPTSYLEVYPQAMANYQGILHMGLAANTNSTSFPKGIYSWGALYPDYPKALTLDHLISTGNKSTTVKIGMIYPVGQKLLASWKDGISYGVDVVDPTAGVYHTSGVLQTNILDGGDIWKNDLYLKARADHLTLAAGEGVQVGYKLDREANYEVNTSLTDPLGKVTANTLSNGRATEGQFQVKLTGPGTSSPTLLALSGQIDSLDTELQF